MQEAPDGFTVRGFFMRCPGLARWGAPTGDVGAPGYLDRGRGQAAFTVTRNWSTSRRSRSAWCERSPAESRT